MQTILVLGAGKIGTLIAFLLANSQDYQVYLADLQIAKREDLSSLLQKSKNITPVTLDAQDKTAVAAFLKKNTVNAIASCLPYYCNIAVATLAQEFNLHYFDLTEDTHTANTILKLAHNAPNAFVPQCGLAPGFISIVANDLMRHFPTLETVKMRVGALPANASNSLHYALTWSTDGLINEYGNACQAIDNGVEIQVAPLEDLEEIVIDGLTYEAFNTSGGIGSLANTYMNKVKYMSYKTIRYPGHCEKMKFLMNDLHMNADRDTLKRILETALPKTSQDVVLVYVSVAGTKDKVFAENNYVKKFYPQEINGFAWSAIQLTTASGLCATVDLVLSQPGKFKGLVKQEQISLAELTNNRFGKYYL